MKLPLRIISTAIMFAVMVLSCSNRENPEPRKGNPAINVSVDSVGNDFVRLKIQAVNFEKVHLLAVPDGGSAPADAKALAESGIQGSTGLYRYENLTSETSYALYFAAEGSGGVFSKMGSLPFKTLTGSLYEWEKARSGVPFFADLVLTYGFLNRNPKYWSEERLRSMVSWTDPETGEEKWLFDAFLALEMRTPSYPPHTFGVGVRDWDDKSIGMLAGNKEDATAFLDYWFMDGNGFTALDNVVGEVAARIGSPATSRKVIVMMPDLSVHERYDVPTTPTTYWGEVNGRRLDFSNVEDRRMGYYWFIDEVRKRFYEKNYQNIELGGFYIMSEELPSMRDGKGGRGGDMIDGQLRDGWEVLAKAWDDVFPAVSNYIHQYHEAVVWIPYRCAAGYRYWKEFGIDYAYMQPNTFWDTKGVNPMSTFFGQISTYDLAMELEFDDRMMPSPVDRSASDYNEGEDYKTYQARWRSYIEGMQSSGVRGVKPIAVYQDTDTFNHLRKSSYKEDIDAFNELCRLIAEDPLKAKNR